MNVLYSPPFQGDSITIQNLRDGTSGAFACSGFSRSKWISVAKSAKLLKSPTEKRDPKKHFSPLVVICDRKHTNRILRPKEGGYRKEA